MSDLNLRKAHAAIVELTRKSRVELIDTTVAINEYDDTTEQLNTATVNALAQFQRTNRLLDVVHEMRSSLGKANASSGINELVARHAALSQRLKVVSPLAALEPQVSRKVIDGNVDRIRTSSADQRLYRHDNVSVCVFDAEQIALFKTQVASIKREMQSISDKLTVLNLQHTIKLSDAAVELLTAEGLM